MLRQTPRFARVLLALFAFSLAFLPAQDQGAKTTGNPKVSLEKLKSDLGALKKDDFAAELDAWKALVAAADQRIVDEKEVFEAAKGADRDASRDKINQLRNERSALIERMEVVISVFKTQGGDAAAYESYLSGLSTHLDLKDPLAIWSWFYGWLTSPEGGIKWGTNIAAAIVILLAFKILSGFVARIMRRAIAASRVQTSDLLRDFFVNAVKKVIFFVGLVIALEKIGVDIGPLLAGMGVAGFVIGFALQGTLSNFASGIMILLYRPYDIGDVIEGAGVKGKVDAMSLVSTTLRTPDNQTVVIPNSSIWGGVITNITGLATRRVDMVFGIGYDDDIEKAEKLLEQIVTAHPKVLADPAPTIKLNELADSSVNFVCRPWSRTEDYWDVYWDVTREVKKRFDAEGLSIPYPQSDIHVHKVEAA